MAHELKVDAREFEHSWNGYKPWEIRLNDRNFQTGDDLILRETKFSGVEMEEQGSPLIYTGREIQSSIVYILEGPFYGLPAGWVVMTVSHNKRLTGLEADA